MNEEVIEVRLLGKNKSIKKNTEAIVELLENNSYLVVKASKPIQCRPPNNDESRTYLTIIKTH